MRRGEQYRASHSRPGGWPVGPAIIAFIALNVAAAAAAVLVASVFGPAAPVWVWP